MAIVITPSMNNNYYKETLLQSPICIPSELPPIIPLTTNASSWILHLPRFAKSPKDRSVFRRFFQTHPREQHAIQIYGKRVLENRYSEMYMTRTTNDDDGNDDSSSNNNVGTTTTTTTTDTTTSTHTYKYSGTTRACRVCRPDRPEEQFILDLCHVSNAIYSKLLQSRIITLNTKKIGGGHAENITTTILSSSNQNQKQQNKTTTTNVYNCCLVNWYEPQHSIGLHADDEQELNATIPIVSLSWGGPRRFLIRPKPHLLNSHLHPTQFAGSNPKTFEIVLKDGDLLVMGGKCQQEFKHEIPNVRKMDGIVGPRISWTVRSMRMESTATMTVKKSLLGKRHQAEDADDEKGGGINKRTAYADV